MRRRHRQHIASAGGPSSLVVAVAVAGFVALGLVMFSVSSPTPATAAHVARLDVTPTQVAPGDQVTVSAAPSGGYGDAEVTVRWDSLEGPVLGTFPSDPFGPETVTIPADATPGRHVLIADQVVGEEGTGVRGIPARADIEVIGAGGPVADAVQDVGSTGLPHLASLEGDGGEAWVLAAIGLLAFLTTVAGGAVVARRARVAPGQPR